jgi:polysaccharide chain length determinant protein (PEP-CTERM system associated)
MNGIADFDISQILSGFYRRKTLIVCVTVVVFLLGVYLAAILPKVYQSSSLILVSPQRIPTSFVSSTITMDLGERMQSIIQEILSRTQLEKIVKEFNLYPGGVMEDRVEVLRKAIGLGFRRNNVFSLSFQSGNPETAKQVASRIASLFIEQNLQVREQQAMGTKNFINAEADRLRKELEEQELVVSQYRATNRFELPDQLDSNLRTLEQLRRELEGSNQRVAALQERKGVLQKQVVESDILGSDLLGGQLIGSTEGAPQNIQVQMRKRELDALLKRYSAKHPDVVRVKKEIEYLEAELPDNGPAKPATAPMSSSVNPLKQVLQTQISDIDSEIQAMNGQRNQLRTQIGALQGRVDAAPMRGIELSKISRNYDITLRKYQDLLAKSLESELSENMEKKQKGEQFQILDPANFPLRPIRPNRPMVVLMGLLLGLGAGFGLAFLWDNLDTSFKRSDDVNAFVKVPLLATIPALTTRSSVLEERRSQGTLVLASLGVLAVGIICVRAFGPLYF